MKCIHCHTSNALTNAPSGRYSNARDSPHAKCSHAMQMAHAQMLKWASAQMSQCTNAQMLKCQMLKCQMHKEHQMLKCQMLKRQMQFSKILPVKNTHTNKIQTKHKQPYI